MKKLLFSLMLLFTMAMGLFAQEVETAPPSVIDFIAANWAAITGIISYVIIEYVVGKTNAVKANSVLGILFDLLKKLFVKK